MIYNAVDLLERGLLVRPLHCQFVLGNRGALPATEHVLDLLLAELTRVMPEATWGALGIGRRQLPVNGWTLARGGYIRTGLEDNIFAAYKYRRRATRSCCGSRSRHARSTADSGPATERLS